MSLIDDSITKTKSIRDLINAESAFQNVYNPVLDVLNTQVETAKGILNVTPPGTPLGDNSTAILGAISSLEITIGRFTSHTNSLSGVGLSTGLSGANVGTVMQVLRTIDRYKEDGAACEFINEVFGSIVQFAQIAEQIRIMVNRLIGLTDEPELLTERINTLITLLEGRIENDILAFTMAQLQALQYAIAGGLSSLLNNECLGEVLGIIGTDQLKKIIIPEVANVLK